MKKLLLLLVAIIPYYFSNAQCTTDVSCLAASESYGFCPDTITPLPDAYVGSPYTLTLSFKVPANGADWGYAWATVNDVEVKKDGSTGTYADGFANLPPGLTYNCFGTSNTCKWNGGTDNCVNIEGTPTTAGSYKIFVYVNAHSGFLSLPDTVRGYKINVLPAQSSQGIRSVSKSTFSLLQNSPNPFNSHTTISFTAGKAEPITFSIVNIVGTEVYSKKFKSIAGENSLAISKQELDLKPGLYLYSISNGSRSYTRKMLVE